MEAVITIDVLRRAGADVTVGSVENQPRVDAAHAVNILADALVSDYANTVFDLIALPVHLSLSLSLSSILSNTWFALTNTTNTLLFIYYSFQQQLLPLIS